METVQEDTINLKINYKSTSHSIDLPISTSLSSLRSSITSLIQVDPSNQKLLPTPRPKSDLWNRAATVSTKGKERDADGNTNGEIDPSLKELGFKDGIKILVLGPQNRDLEEMEDLQRENEKRNAPRTLHPSLLRGTKPRSTVKPLKTIFHSLQVHPTTSPNSPLHSKIHSYLIRLSSDPAIIHVCSLHSYQVGILTELLPHENPNLLGLNTNHGEKISLRIRVDDYDSNGLRDYKTTRRVLLHELAHIEVSDHNQDFKELNSLLNRQVLEFEENSRGERLEEGEFYQPTTMGGRDLDEEREERRIRILKATMSRLAKEEKEIEVGCGNAESSNRTVNGKQRESKS